jgi:flagellar hook capping protein FlgD
VIERQEGTMLGRNRVSRGFARACVLTALLGMCLAARTASAWTYPLLPHVQGLAFFPERPNDAQRTGFLLSAVYPDSCWRLVDAQLTDSAHVRVTLVPDSTCGDTGSSWTAGWDLGLLVAGMHTLTVRATIQYSPSMLYPPQEEITVPYEVSVSVPPPPPPPPGPGIDTLTSLVLLVEVTPGAPVLGDHVQVHFRGRYPFDCGSLADPSNADPANLQLTLATTPGCADTTRVWDTTFDLGIPSAGDHVGLLHIHVPSLALERLQGFGFHVTDPNGPPPPPPPPPGIDTTNTLVNWVEVTPGAPVLGDRVSVHFRGRYPFDCGSLADKYIAEPESLRLRLSLETTPGCGDTTRVWDTTFDLGVPSAGDHTGLLHIHVPSLGLDRYQGFGFHVTDPNAPPPPPPGDSLKAGLSASAPNPFSDRTTFAVSLADPTLAEVAVFDLSGRRVTTIHRGLLPRGTSNLAWDGRRQDGSRAAGGIYFYRLTLPERVVTRRVVLLGAP